MTKKTRKNYPADYRLEVAQQVVDQGRSIREVAEAMGLGKSTVDKWACALRQERNGLPTKSAPITAEQAKIKELERKIKHLEDDNRILKKASALLMRDAFKHLS